MDLYKLTNYPNSVSLNEREFRIAIQGGYEQFIVTWMTKQNYPNDKKTFVVTKNNFMCGVVNASMKMTKPGFGSIPKPYWVVRF